MRIQQVVPENTGNTDTRTQARLADAARQFEGMFLQEMLKPLRSKDEDGSWNSGDDDSSNGSDTINSFGVEAVATAIAKSGGLGIARQVMKQVTAEQDKVHSSLQEKQLQKA